MVFEKDATHTFKKREGHVYVLILVEFMEFMIFMNF